MFGQFPEIIKSLPRYDGDFDAYKLEAKGSDILFAFYPAGKNIPPHTHETDNHGIVTRGEFILTMNGTAKRIAPGQWYHIPAQVEHSARFEVDTDQIEFWFH